MKVICALLCLAVVAHGANVLRVARNTEAIIPSIVEEILKVELKSDLKKNSAVEVEEKEPVVKEEEAIAGRTAAEEPKAVVEEQKVVVEEKMPIVDEPLPSTRTVSIEKAPEMVEKIVEVVAIEQVPEKQVDSFRTESEQPVVAEIVKETVVVEPMPEVRSDVAEVVVTKEEEMIKPMVRNVIKEEIPQVEELRVIPGMNEAVQDRIPEPVAASNIAQSVLEVEPQVKTVITETIVKEEVPMMIEEIKMEIKSVPEMIMMTKTEELPAVVPEVKAVVVEEVKKVETEKMEEGEMVVPAVKDVDGRQNIIQQASQVLSQVPIIGQIVQRITPTTEAAVAADAPPAEAENSEAPALAEGEVAAAPASDEATVPPTPQNPIQAIVQNLANSPLGMNVQQGVQSFQQGLTNQVQNVQNFLTGNTANNSPAPVSDSQDDKPPQQNLIQQAIGQVSNLLGNVVNAVRPQTTQAPTKTEEAPSEVPAEPVAEEGKSVEPQTVSEPVAVEKKEEMPVEKVEKVEAQS